MNFNHNEYFDKFNKLAKNGQNVSSKNPAIGDKKPPGSPNADTNIKIDPNSGNKP